MLVVCACYLCYAMGEDRKILDNCITKFISGISMEIYLCHMVIYRIGEKLGLVKVVGDNVYSYIIMTMITILGAIIFSFVSKKIIDYLVKKMFSKSI